ncbi:MAG: hypothetical protein AAGB02_03795 [Pseudomonadota bacterium]
MNARSLIIVCAGAAIFACSNKPAMQEKSILGLAPIERPTVTLAQLQMKVSALTEIANQKDMRIDRCADTAINHWTPIHTRKFSKDDRERIQTEWYEKERRLCLSGASSFDVLDALNQEIDQTQAVIDASPLREAVVAAFGEF